MRTIHIRNEQQPNVFISLCCSSKPIPLVLHRFDIKDFQERQSSAGYPVDVCKKCLDKLLDYFAGRITSGQRHELERLWFVFGNRGPKHTQGNHGFIQGFLQYTENRKKFYLNAPKDEMIAKGIDFEKVRLTGECISAVEQVFLNF